MIGAPVQPAGKWTDLDGVKSPDVGAWALCTAADIVEEAAALERAHIAARIAAEAQDVADEYELRQAILQIVLARAEAAEARAVSTRKG